MLDQLINLGKQQLSQTLKEKANLNDQQVGSTFDVAKGSLLDGLKDQALSGNLSQITDIFNGKSTNTSGLQSSVINKFVPQLATKLSIPAAQATSIANMVIPFLISKFSSKETGTVNDSGDLAKMLGVDTGNILGGLGKSLGGFFS